MGDAYHVLERLTVGRPQGPIHWGQRIVGLANLVDEDRVFIPAEHAAEWKDEVV